MAEHHYIMETWRVIYDAPNYAVSDAGRIMRVQSAQLARIGRVLKAGIDGTGYRHVKLITPEGKAGFQVHRLVCKAFHGFPPSRLHQAAHINGDRLDNRACNLRWATPAENCADRNLHGTAPTGARNPNRSLTEEDVRYIRAYPKTHGSNMALARKFGVSDTCIIGIQSGRTWKHLP